MGMRWYVIMTNPGAEQTARAELGRAGFPVFLPTRILETTADRRVAQTQRQAPLFPSYLFINLDLTDPTAYWRVAATRRGVHRFLGSTEAPAPVLVGVVEEIHARWLAGEFDERLQNQRQQLMRPRVEVTQPGRVTVAGHFADQVGECLYSSARRIDLLLGVMRVRFTPEQVAIAV